MGVRRGSGGGLEGAIYYSNSKWEIAQILGARADGFPWPHRSANTRRRLPVVVFCWSTIAPGPNSITGSRLPSTITLLYVGVVTPLSPHVPHMLDLRIGVPGRKKASPYKGLPSVHFQLL